MATNTTTSNTIYIGIGSSIFTASLLSNPSVTAFTSLLPLQLGMSELNGNEKFADLPIALPTDASNPGAINTGDLMLYGSRTLVLWYEDYSSSYTYTRIGSINSTEELVAAVGRGSINVRFANDVAGVTSSPGNGTGNTGSTTSSSATARKSHVSGQVEKSWLLTSLLGLMFVLSP